MNNANQFELGSANFARYFDHFAVIHLEHLQLLLMAHAQVLKYRLVFELRRSFPIRLEALQNIKEYLLFIKKKALNSESSSSYIGYVVLSTQKFIRRFEKIVQVVQSLGETFDLFHLRIVLDLCERFAYFGLQVAPFRARLETSEHLFGFVDHNVQLIMRISRLDPIK